MAFPVPARRLVARWEADGLIDHATAMALQDDLVRRRSRFGVGAFLALLGGVLLAAAILALVVTDWEAMPRLLRLGLVVAVIWAGYVGGAWYEGRGDHGRAAALYVVAALAFGGGIALVGEMYRIAGDAADATLVWTFGVLLAASVLRSSALAALAIVAGAAYLVAAASDDSLHSGLYIVVVPFVASAGCALAVFTRGRLVRHLVAALLIAFGLAIRINLGFPSVAWAMVLGGAALVVAESRWPDRFQRATGFGAQIGAYAFAGAFVALLFEQFGEGPVSTVPGVVFDLMGLALAIGALVAAGRSNPALRWLAYGGFSIEALHLVSGAAGSVVGRPGSILAVCAAGLLMVAVVVQIERRFRGTGDAEASSSRANVVHHGGNA